MSGANRRNPSTNRRAAVSNPGTGPGQGSPARTAEEQDTVRRGLHILARIIARVHLGQQPSQPGPETGPPVEGEDGD